MRNVKLASGFWFVVLLVLGIIQGVYPAPWVVWIMVWVGFTLGRLSVGYVMLQQVGEYLP